MYRRRVPLMLRIMTSVALVCALCSSCVPPELMEASAEAVPFEPVAELARTSCSAKPSCHGSTSMTAFVIEGDGAASDAQVHAAIAEVTTTAGVPMVVPGAPDQSALYLRLVETGPNKMPPDGTLSEEQIESVRAWIEDGAHYE